MDLKSRSSCFVLNRKGLTVKHQYLIILYTYAGSICRTLELTADTFVQCHACCHDEHVKTLTGDELLVAQKLIAAVRHSGADIAYDAQSSVPIRGVIVMGME